LGLAYSIVLELYTLNHRKTKETSMHNGVNDKSHHTQAERMKHLIEEMALKGKALFSEGLENAKGLYEERAAQLKRKATEMGADELGNEIRSYVRKNPIQCIAIAAGVGLLAGYLLKSRKKANA
jgi:ElaB/YqjD/DUF883 family membrane-anchored ribosome-binding protein